MVWCGGVSEWNRQQPGQCMLPAKQVDVFNLKRCRLFDLLKFVICIHTKVDVRECPFIGAESKHFSWRRYVCMLQMTGTRTRSYGMLQSYVLSEKKLH